MTVTFPATPGMLQTPAYHHVAVATGTRQVHVAGQVARDVDGAPSTPDDLAGQVAHALRATGRRLAAAGAGFADVVRLTFYVVDWAPGQIDDLMAGVASVAGDLGLPQPLPPASLIGVQALYEPGVLVEVEATAVLP